MNNPMPHDSSVYTRVPEEATRVDWILKNAVGKMLEVGCANGDIIGKYGNGTGVDCDEDRIKIAMAKYPEVQFYCGDVRIEMSFFLENYYDTILFAEVLEHMPMSDAQRVLKEGYNLATKRVIITIDRDRPIESVPLGHLWETDKKHMEELLSVIKGKQIWEMAGKSWGIIIDKEKSG